VIGLFIILISNNISFDFLRTRRELNLAPFTHYPIFQALL